MSDTCDNGDGLTDNCRLQPNLTGEAWAESLVCTGARRNHIQTLGMNDTRNGQQVVVVRPTSKLDATLRNEPRLSSTSYHDGTERQVLHRCRSTGGCKHTTAGEAGARYAAGAPTRECGHRGVFGCTLPAIVVARQQMIGVSPVGPYYDNSTGSPTERLQTVRTSSLPRRVTWACCRAGGCSGTLHVDSILIRAEQQRAATPTLGIASAAELCLATTTVEQTCRPRSIASAILELTLSAIANGPEC